MCLQLHIRLPNYQAVAASLLAFSSRVAKVCTGMYKHGMQVRALSFGEQDLCTVIIRQLIKYNAMHAATSCMYT
jgi:hypothetical protein